MSDTGFQGLRLDLRGFPQGECDTVLDLEGPELGITDDELPLEGPLSIALAVHRLEERLTIRGTVTGRVREACARCGREIHRPLNVEFMLLAEERPEGAAPDAGPDDDIVYHDGQMLDLSDHVRQVVMVDAPMAPLCREDCQGLCPGCGADLADGACRCEPAPPDPRWRKLDKLLQDSRPEGQSEN